MFVTSSKSVAHCLSRGALLLCACVLCSCTTTPPATTVAYAHVLGNGTLDTANSKNVLAMAGGNGLYCFTLAFSPQSAVATIAEDPTAPNQGPGFIRVGLPPTPLFTCATIPAPNAVVATFNQTQSIGGYAFYVYWTK